jgi:hypothetical protein
MNRYLITTADERSWKFDRPVLFLGEWCRRYDRKQVWERMDAAVAEPYGLQAGLRERDIAYVQVLSKSLLEELSEALNAFHHTRHSLRYWHIILGPWLQRYVAVTFNRYFTLEQALKDHTVFGTTVFDFTAYSLATNDTLAFFWACNDDVWNHVLYAKILHFLGNIPIEQDSEPLRGISSFGQVKAGQAARRAGVKRSILDAANSILQRIGRERDALIINSCLPLREEIALQLRLGQFPHLRRSPALDTVAPDSESRRRVDIAAGNYSGFERFVRTQLHEIIPTCFLEGYPRLIRQVKAVRWPVEPRFIFTSNSFDTDEIFKAWTGLKTEEGCPYFVGQHGSNYGTLLSSPDWVELVTCDKFLTWGWTNDNPRNVPAFVFTIVGRKPRCFDPNGGLLLSEVHLPHRFGPEDIHIEHGIHQDEQFRFVAALPESIRRVLTVRLHRAYTSLSWCDEQRWHDRWPEVAVDTGSGPIRKIIARSRLVVHSYDSAGILENLALNIPMMCYWYGGLRHLLPSAKPYYEMLKSTGILHDTPESIAAMITAHWDNLGEWWESSKVRTARSAFCAQFARTAERPVQALSKLLQIQAKHARAGLVETLPHVGQSGLNHSGDAPAGDDGIKLKTGSLLSGEIPQAEKIYRDGSYIELNPSLHAEDVEYKLGHIRALLNEEPLSARKVRILDVGGGSGLIAAGVGNYLSARGCTVECVGLEISPEMLQCQRINNRYLIASTDDFDTAARHGPFDLVLLIDVIEHVAEPAVLVDKVDLISDRILYNIPIERNLADLVRNVYCRGHYYERQTASLGHIHFFSWRSARRFVDTHHHAVRWRFPNYAAHILTTDHPDYLVQREFWLRNIELRVAKVVRAYLPWFAPLLVQGSMFILARSRRYQS